MTERDVPSKPQFPPELVEEYNKLIDEFIFLQANTPQIRDAITEEQKAAHQRMAEISRRRKEINATVFEPIRRIFYAEPNEDMN